MIDWAKQNIFTTEGRLNRLKYFQYTLLVSLACGVLEIVAVVLASKITGWNEGWFLSAIGFAASLPMFFGNAMVSVRRCHDLNMSGKWVLLSVVPIVNLLFGIYLLFAKGNYGFNQYGPDPLMVEK